MKKIALLTLLLINLSLSFSLPRNQASPAIFSVTKTNNSILFRHTDSTLTAIPCQSVASIVSNADPSKIVSVWVVQQGDYDKIMQFDYLVCGFSSKSDAVDSLTAWAICDTSSGGGGGGGDVTQSALDDTSSALNSRISAKQNTLVSGTNIKTINSTTLLGSGNLPINVGVVYRTDSIRLYVIGGTDTIVFGYAVRGLTYASDTLSWYEGGTRYAEYIGGGGGGGSLSGLTAATATNNIQNDNFKQEWKWDSLANNTGLKLSSTSGGLLNTVNKLFECELTGAMTASGSSSYAGYFKNTQTVGSGIGLYAEGPTTAINAVGNINTSTGLYINSNFGIFNSVGGSTVKAASSLRLNLRGDNLVNFQNIDGDVNYASINNITNNVRQSLLFNGVYSGGLFYCSATTSAMVERSSDKLIFSANSGLTANTSFTPNNIMTVYGTNSNVGIGTTTPVASAILDLTSTTKGFLPPRMTATQASAISSPAQGLMLFVTDTDGTFTSVGWWGYNGSTWEKLNN